ncbi:hypothetical protein EDB85DRAFT_754528 [Lactarius pseudohatsudake]|nr:hypothetical protein EDB85DRAFT_754528 [Lactarius pseudohatsudake]
MHIRLDGKVVKVTPMETLSTHYKRPSRPIAIRKPSPSSLALSDRLGGYPSFPGEFGAADLSVSASVNSSAAAIFASASPPGGSVESLLQASSFPSTAIAPPLSVAAAARRPMHRMRHSVDAPVLALKDANALSRRDSSPDAPSLDIGPSPGRVALRRDSVRCGQRGATYVPRRSSPDDGGIGGDGDSLVPIPFPRVVSGAPKSSPLNTPSLSQSPSFDPVERATSNKRGASLTSLVTSFPRRRCPPQGRFQSEVDGASSRRRPRFDSMVNLGVASEEQANASNLMARDATEGSVSRPTLVVREEGRHQRTFNLAIVSDADSLALYRALDLNTGQIGWTTCIAATSCIATSRRRTSSRPRLGT